MSQNKSLSTQEVADILHVSKNTIYGLIRRGEINSYKIGRKVRFTQEDVDAYIARSRHTYNMPQIRQVKVSSSLLYGEKVQDNYFILSGQDVVLDILSNYLRRYGIQAVRAYVGSFESLLSLYQDNVQVATCHLWDGDHDEYNVPYVRRLIPGTPAVIINMTYRMQGFYVAKGNPKGIKSWEDLSREDVTIINRRKGSGSRILLDEHLRKRNIPASQINGYYNEMSSHLTLASVISKGEADVGLGTERVTRQVDGIEFVPLQRERNDLIVKKETFDTFEVQKMLEVLRSVEFQSEIASVSGNDYSDMGKILAEV